MDMCYVNWHRNIFSHIIMECPTKLGLDYKVISEKLKVVCNVLERIEFLQFQKIHVYALFFFAFKLLVCVCVCVCVCVLGECE